MALLQALDRSWDRAAAQAPDGNRRRWVTTCAELEWGSADRDGPGRAS